ncbi:MAG: hypothetical protein ACPG06_10560 [Alphaproteobacteria bacterium]
MLSAVFAMLIVVGLPSLANATDANLKTFKVPRHVQAGLNYGGYVSLKEPAPPGGQILAIASDSDDIEVPRLILVKEGTLTGRFPISINDIARSGFANIAISDGEGALQVKMRINPAPAQSRTILQRQVQTRWRVATR